MRLVIHLTSRTRKKHTLMVGVARHVRGNAIVSGFQFFREFSPEDFQGPLIADIQIGIVTRKLSSRIPCLSGIQRNATWEPSIDSLLSNYILLL